MLEVLADYTVRIKLSDGHFIVGGSPLTLETGDPVFALSPDEDPDKLFWPLNNLVGRTVLTASVESGGTLSIDFGQERLLTVKPDMSYEAWSVFGPDGALTVCVPGGELAYWLSGPGNDEIPDETA